MKLDANIIIATANDLARQHFREPTEQMERLAWHVGLLNGRIRELVAVINDKDDTIEQIKGIEGNAWRNLMERWTNQSTAGTQVVPPNKPVAHGQSVTIGDVEFKLHFYGQAHTQADLSVQVVPDRVTHVGDIAMTNRGLVLVVGATGSGKSTSLAAMIDHRNSIHQGHIITMRTRSNSSTAIRSR